MSNTQKRIILAFIIGAIWFAGLGIILNLLFHNDIVTAIGMILGIVVGLLVYLYLP
jgi:hypothetical protein